MQTFAINTDNDRPIKSEHVSFFTETNEKEITLKEVVRNTYKHPDAPQDLVISVLEIVTLLSGTIGTNNAATIELVSLADKNAQSIAATYYNRQ